MRNCAAAARLILSGAAHGRLSKGLPLFDGFLRRSVLCASGQGIPSAACAERPVRLSSPLVSGSSATLPGGGCVHGSSSASFPEVPRPGCPRVWAGGQADRAARLSSQRPLGRPARPYATASPAAPPTHVPIECQTAILFEKCWARVEASLQGELKLPREIIWLNGAPGAGKGANTEFILAIRGLNRAITMSDLLKDYPQVKALKDEGKLVPDEVVIEALIKALVNPDDNDGVGLVVDGFPRSAMQVDIVQALFDKLQILHDQHYDAPDSQRYPRPCFKIVILYVDEKTSVDRQVFRAKKAAAHNRHISDAGGLGKQREERSTDLDVEKAMARYDTFKRNYSTVLKLKEHFPFSIIDGMGTLEESEAQIARELRYQSSLDLYEEAYRLITPIPLVYEIVKEARMSLVDRLNSYVKSQKPLFEEVVNVVHDELLPQIRKGAQAGFTEFRTRDAPFKDSTVACQILIDVLADRGFSCSHTVEERLAPYKFDLQSGKVFCEPWVTHCFRVSFTAKSIRSTPPREDRRLSATDVAERIGTTTLPIGFDHSEKPGMSRQRKHGGKTTQSA